MPMPRRSKTPVAKVGVVPQPPKKSKKRDSSVTKFTNRIEVDGKLNQHADRSTIYAWTTEMELQRLACGYDLLIEIDTSDNAKIDDWLLTAIDKSPIPLNTSNDGRIVIPITLVSAKDRFRVEATTYGYVVKPQMRRLDNSQLVDFLVKALATIPSTMGFRLLPYDPNVKALATFKIDTRNYDASQIWFATSWTRPLPLTIQFRVQDNIALLEYESNIAFSNKPSEIIPSDQLNKPWLMDVSVSSAALTFDFYTPSETLAEMDYFKYDLIDRSLIYSKRHEFVSLANKFFGAKSKSRIVILGAIVPETDQQMAPGNLVKFHGFPLKATPVYLHHGDKSTFDLVSMFSVSEKEFALRWKKQIVDNQVERSATLTTEIKHLEDKLLQLNRELAQNNLIIESVGNNAKTDIDVIIAKLRKLQMVDSVTTRQESFIVVTNDLWWTPTKDDFAPDEGDDDDSGELYIKKVLGKTWYIGKYKIEIRLGLKSMVITNIAAANKRYLHPHCSIGADFCMGGYRSLFYDAVVNHDVYRLVLTWIEYLSSVSLNDEIALEHLTNYFGTKKPAKPVTTASGYVYLDGTKLKSAEHRGQVHDDGEDDDDAEDDDDDDY